MSKQEEFFAQPSEDFHVKKKNLPIDVAREVAAGSNILNHYYYICLPLYIAERFYEVLNFLQVLKKNHKYIRFFVNSDVPWEQDTRRKIMLNPAPNIEMMLSGTNISNELAGISLEIYSQDEQYTVDNVFIPPVYLSNYLLNIMYDIGCVTHTDKHVIILLKNTVPTGGVPAPTDYKTVCDSVYATPPDSDIDSMSRPLEEVDLGAGEDVTGWKIRPDDETLLQPLGQIDYTDFSDMLAPLQDAEVTTEVDICIK